MNPLADELRRVFPGHTPVLTARATAALVLYFTALRREAGPGEVVVPASVCPTVPLAVHYAGLSPRFCDVEPDTFGISERTLWPCLNTTTRAVVAVYLFGKSLDAAALCALTRRHGAHFIEDLAHGVGGARNDKLLGDFGDAAVLSFNDVKIIPGRGGALVVRDPRLARVVEELQEQLPGPLAHAERTELETSFHHLTHGLYHLLRARHLQEAATFLADVADHYRPLFVYRQPFNDDELHARAADVRGLPETRAARHRVYRMYEEHLAPYVPFPRFTPDEMCWRLPVLLRNHRQQLEMVEDVRRRGVLISNHYFPPSFLFGDGAAACARDIGLRVVNFWVDGKAQPERIPEICALVSAAWT